MADKSDRRFLTPWAEKSGFEPPLLMNMAMTVVFCACGIIFWFYGKKMRGLTAKSFVHKEECASVSGSEQTNGARKSSPESHSD